ncbi:MAG: SsrA-binding protein SmpB [Candidatus Pacebacteria bacterium]|nr:SsrA-binding protein SmpB [Candidatus Paceibacterota bacterium]
MSLIKNAKVTFDYEILETYTAGIELVGVEVKSVRAGRGSLKGAHVTIRGGEAYLIDAEIPAFQPKNAPKDFDPLRRRTLLLHKKELEKLAQSENTKGFTIVPISMYSKGRFIKIDIAIARGKKKYDKRESIKKRESSREINRTMKRHR